MPKRAFLSPRINPLMIAAVRLLMPTLLRTMFGGLSVQIADEDLHKLRRYRGQRMMLLPNHPTGEEPAVMFEISKQLNEVFNFVAARELFTLEHGFRGWVMRRLGVYSVIRGATDRESFMTSKSILMEGKNRLVIFIEGEISRENDTLIPFEPGVIQLGYWAQEALVKEAAAREPKAARRKNRKDSANASSDSTADYPPILLVPVAIKYFYDPGVEAAIEQSLKNLEQVTGTVSPPGADWQDRIRALGERILTVQEGLHQMISLPGTTLNERVEAIKSRMLKKMELFLDLRPDPQATTLTRMRDVRNTIDRLVHTYDDPQDLTDYEKRMVDHFRLALSEFYQDLERVGYFLTYDETYLREQPSNERFIEMIRRLEKEVFGDPRLSYPRTAVVKVGEVTSLKEHYAEYEADKKGFVNALAQQLEDDMMTMLSHIRRPGEVSRPPAELDPHHKVTSATERPA